MSDRAYYALISGESVDLAKAEVDALVRMTSASVRVAWHGRMAVIQTDCDPTETLVKRAALVKEAGRILFAGDLDDPVLDEHMRGFIGTRQTFCVYTAALNAGHTSESRAELRVSLGQRIRTASGAQVSLESPQVGFTAIVDDDAAFLCESTESKIRRDLRTRKAGSRPFFHPSMMNSVLARILCNLAQLRPGQILLDPFCGAGGILCEAALMGASTVGIDVNWKLLRGAMINLTALGVRNNVLLLGDSRYIPLKRADCIVTDPPYGRVSSTRGARSVALVRRMIEQLECVLHRSARVCFCGSEEMKLEELVRNMGYDIDLLVKVRVHGGLVREVFRICV